MKKLLIAMTAAAVGTCAWATEDAPALLSENFDAWTNGADLEYMTALPEGLWSYSAEQLGEGELKVVAEGEGDNALSLNTGSKVLNAKFAENAVDMALAPYFNATVTFKDPSDTLPALGDNDKFALVVLDNVESVDAEYTSDAATNLWVIAKYGENAQRAYRLNVAVTESWLAAEHSIVVKGYGNVMASGNTACAGFLVMVDKAVCTVVESCAIVNGVINYREFCSSGNWKDGENLNLGYLGYAKSAIAGSIQKRYEDAQLILSNVPNSDTLASVDFQGQGVIDNVSLAKTTVEEFGSDSLVFTVEGTANGVTITSDKTVYYSAANETKNITFTLATGWVLKGVAAGLTPDANGVYTYQYTTVAENDQVVKIEAYQPAAYVGNSNTAYETFSAALAAAIAGGGKLTLASDVKTADLAEGFINIESGTIEIDLNGKEIVDIVNNGNLTIKDSVGTGVVLAAATDDAYSVDNTGTLTILGGCFNGGINGATAKGISGGKFKVKPDVSALADGRAFSENADSNGYYSVVTASEDVFEDVKTELVDGEITEEQKASVDATLTAIAGDAEDPAAAVATYISNAYGTDKVPVAALAGAVNVDVSVNNNLPLMTSENAEFVAEAVAADDGNVAAFEFALQDGSADKVLPLTVKAKLENIIKVCTDLNTWVNAKIEAEGVADADVKATVSNGKVKVQLKSKTGGKCFMKLKAE